MLNFLISVASYNVVLGRNMIFTTLVFLNKFRNRISYGAVPDDRAVCSCSIASVDPNAAEDMDVRPFCLLCVV